MEAWREGLGLQLPGHQWLPLSRSCPLPRRCWTDTRSRSRPEPRGGGSSPEPVMWRRHKSCFLFSSSAFALWRIRRCPSVRWERQSLSPRAWPLWSQRRRGHMSTVGDPMPSPRCHLASVPADGVPSLSASSFSRGEAGSESSCV